MRENCDWMQLDPHPEHWFGEASVCSIHSVLQNAGHGMECIPTPGPAPVWLKRQVVLYSPGFWGRAGTAIVWAHILPLGPVTHYS